MERISKEYLDILFKVSGDHPDLHFDLSYLGDYGKDINGNGCDEHAHSFGSEVT